MRNIVHYLVVITMLLASVHARAAVEDYAITAGVEQFLWQEFDRSGSKLLDETGPRYFVAIEAEKRISRVWRYGFLAKLYSGQVDYDGERCDLLSSSCTQYSTDTDYDGWNMEVDFFQSLRQPGAAEGDSAWYLRYSLGYDSWRRNILGSGGYEEKYQSFYGRLGVDYHAAAGWRIQGGVKYPFNTIEDVGLTSLGFASDPTLKPGGDFSLYLAAQYRFHPNWGMGAFYDSFRFKKSGTERVYHPGLAAMFDVWQPESRQDIYGIKLEYHF